MSCRNDSNIITAQIMSTVFQIVLPSTILINGFIKIAEQIQTIIKDLSFFS